MTTVAQHHTRLTDRRTDRRTTYDGITRLHCYCTAWTWRG